MVSFWSQYGVTDFMHQPISCSNQITRDQVRCNSVAVVVEIYVRMASFDFSRTRVAVAKEVDDDVVTRHAEANKFAYVSYVSLLFSADARTVLHAMLLSRLLQHSETGYARRADVMASTSGQEEQRGFAFDVGF